MRLEEFSTYLIKWVNSLEIFQDKRENIIDVAKNAEFSESLFFRLHNREQLSFNDALKLIKESYRNFDLKEFESYLSNFIYYLGVIMFDKIVKNDDKWYRDQLLAYIDVKDHSVYQKFFEYLADFEKDAITFDVVKLAIENIDTRDSLSNLDCSIYDSSRLNTSTPLQVFFDTPKTERVKCQMAKIKELKNQLELEQKEKNELVEDFNDTKRRFQLLQKKFDSEKVMVKKLKSEYRDADIERESLKETNIKQKETLNEFQKQISNLEKQILDFQKNQEQLANENSVFLDRISELEGTIEMQSLDMLVYKQKIEGIHTQFDKLADTLVETKNEKNELIAKNLELSSLVKDFELKQKIDKNLSHINDSFRSELMDVSTQSDVCVNNLQNELQELEINDLQKKLNDLQNNYNMKIKELSDKQNEITKLTKQIDDQNCEITTLNDQKDFIEKESRKTIDGLNNELQNEQSKYQRIFEDYNIVSELNTGFFEEIKQKDDLRVNLECQIKMLDKECEKLTKELQSESNLFVQKEVQYLEQVKKLEQLKKTNLDEINNLKEKLQKSNDDRDHEKSNMVTELQRFRDDFNNLNIKNDALCTQMELLRNNNQDLTISNNQLQDEINQLCSVNELLNNEISDLKIVLKNHEEVTLDNEHLSSELNMIKKRLLNLENNFESHSELFDNINNAELNLESKTDYLFELIARKSTLLDNKDNEIKKLISNNENHLENLKSIEEIKNDLMRSLNLKTEQLQQSTETIYNLKTSIDDVSKTLNEYKIKNSVLESQLEAYENTIKNYEIDKKTMLNVNTILETKLRDYEDREIFESEKYLNSLSAKDNEIDNLKKQINNDNLLIKDLRKEISNKTIEFNNLKDHLIITDDNIDEFGKFLNCFVSNLNIEDEVYKLQNEKLINYMKITSDYKNQIDAQLLENDIKENSFIKLIDKLNEEKALLMNDKALLQKENDELELKFNELKDRKKIEIENLKAQLLSFNEIKSQIIQLEKLKNIFVEEKMKLITKLISDKQIIDKQMWSQNLTIKQLNEKLNNLLFLKGKFLKKVNEIEVKRTLIEATLCSSRKLFNESVRNIFLDISEWDKKLDANFNKVINTKDFDEKFLNEKNIDHFSELNEKLIELDRFLNEYMKMIEDLEANCDKNDLDRLKQTAVNNEFRQKYFLIKQQKHNAERTSLKYEEEIRLLKKENRFMNDQLKQFEKKKLSAESCEAKITQEVKSSFQNDLLNLRKELNERFEEEKLKLIKKHEAEVLKLESQFEERLKKNTLLYKEKYEKVCKLYQNHDELYLKEMSEEQQKSILKENKLKSELEERNATIDSLREKLKEMSMKYIKLKNEGDKSSIDLKDDHKLLSAEHNFLTRCEDFDTDSNQSLFETKSKNVLDFPIVNEDIVHEIKGLNTDPNTNRPLSINLGSKHSLNETNFHNNTAVDRLNEIQYRNSLCLPHLKSAYPAETQFLKPSVFDENEIRIGRLFSINDSNAHLLPGEKPKKKDLGRKVRPSSPIRKTVNEFALREKNTINCMPTLKKMSTPMRVRQLFTRKTPIKDKDQQENIETAKVTPKSRKLSLFRSK